jgi:hypothetical protein
VNLGTQVKSVVTDCQDVYVTSAVGEDGRCGVLVSFFTNDKNVVAKRKVEIEIDGKDIKEAMSYVTDEFHVYTQVPVDFNDGKTSFWLAPNSFVYIDIR